MAVPKKGGRRNDEREEDQQTCQNARQSSRSEGLKSRRWQRHRTVKQQARATERQRSERNVCGMVRRVLSSTDFVPVRLEFAWADRGPAQAMLS